MRRLSPSEQALIDQLHLSGVRVEIVQQGEWFTILADGHGQKHVARGTSLQALLEAMGQVFGCHW